MGILLDNMYLSVTSCTAGLLVNRHRDDPSTCHLRESTEELAGLLLLAIIDLKVKKNQRISSLVKLLSKFVPLSKQPHYALYHRKKVDLSCFQTKYCQKLISVLLETYRDTLLPHCSSPFHVICLSVCWSMHFVMMLLWDHLADSRL